MVSGRGACGWGSRVERHSGEDSWLGWGSDSGGGLARAGVLRQQLVRRAK